MQRPPSIAATLEAAARALAAGAPAEAERLARHVLASAKVDVTAGRLLGQALLAQGRAEAAIEPLRRAARRGGDPETKALLARAVLQHGDALGRAGRHAEAAAVFEQGIALCPEAPVLRVGLAFVALQANDRTRARALFAVVRAGHPGRHDATLGLAHVLMADGDYAGAADLYREALARKPEDASTRIELAKCLLELGDRAAGEAELRAAAAAGAQAAADALTALCGVSHGRAFLRPSAAARFLAGGSSPEAAPIHPPLAADLA